MNLLEALGRGGGAGLKKKISYYNALFKIFYCNFLLPRRLECSYAFLMAVKISLD